MPSPLRRWRPLMAAMLIAAAGHAFGTVRLAVAQEAAPATAAAPEAAGSESLAEIEARLADRYARLETLVERLAELSRSTQPRRATLLRQLISQSRDRDVTGRFEKVIAALEQESFSSAIDGQTALEVELNKLLELLLQEDRDRQIDSERKRIGRYLQEVNRLIRMQRGVKARTDGGDEAQELADDQQQVGDKTRELGDEVEEAEQTAAEKAASESPEAGGENSGGKPDKGESPEDGEPKAGEANEAEPKPADSDVPKQPDAAEPKSGEPTPGDEAQQESSKSGENKPGESPADQGKPSEGKPSEGKPSQGSPPESSGEQGQPSESGGEQQAAEPPPDNPMQRAAQKLRQAQQRMEQAQQKLEESQRDGAVEDQAKAVEELEQAKAELERILRQLREEELERMLVMLEARFRKMLDAQVEVYDETKKLDAATEKAPEHELEIAGGRLARKETLIVREADRALLLLREDGTSTAFPEAIEQARDDMESIAERLRETHVDLITQGLEEDVIAALEETLAALQQALKDLREQKGQPQQGQGQSQPGEKPLVDQLAELRMIRSLQVRVNKRTQQYGAMIEGEQAEEADLLEALDGLALRQQKIFQATRELTTKEN
ncbi:MAG: hypothetical protein JNL18_13790 [Planctomycetaceae bacterium]|nr:hypothetical protein [Planctomycetaceae bacterium]